LSQYKTVPFYNNWLDTSGFLNENGKGNKINVPIKTIQELENFTDEKLKKWRIEAAERCHATLGQFPALCFSGGIDSQAMLHCFAEADLEAHVIIFTFKDGLNKHDVDHAKAYCHTFDIPYREIEFDIVSFLTRDNLAMTEQYGGLSPQFNTHYRFVEILTHMGYTGVCFGGGAPDRVNGDYGTNFEKNAMHWLKCHDKFQIAVQGSFLSFSPELALALAVSTPEAGVTLEEDHADWETYKKIRHAKYEQKIIGYKRIGFDIMQQDTKYTGFEKVKDFFEEKTGDGWAFERQFRDPLAKGPDVNKDMNEYKIDLKAEQKVFLDSIYYKHFPARP
jgi:hypothetical protein|tara:strand:- start:13158 stop:14159 length:1002 start_codon:yes stop_codon:yes gene_type:complete